MNDVSVIIPTWNRRQLLERALCSCLAQTVPVREVLVCDDGSTDGTAEMVKAFADPRVIWCPGDRGGRPAIPRNRGIRNSRGAWLAFLDDDDEWLPDKVKLQLDLADRLGCAAVCGNAFRILRKGEPAGLVLGSGAERLSFRELVGLNRVVCSSAMVRRELFQFVAGFPENPEIVVGEDYALWLRVATQTDFAFVNSPLVRYSDDPEHSLRRGQDDLLQTCNVFADFAKWAATDPALTPCLKIAETRLRELQRTDRGRPRPWWARLAGWLRP